MSESKTLFATQRRIMYESYAAANQPFSASTKPYKSTVTFGAAIVNSIAAVGVSFAVFPAQRREWFSYKLNDAVPGNELLPTYRTALESDTNISKPRTTNGAEDFVIEGMSASCRNTRIQYLVGNIPAAITGGDANVLAALLGLESMLDPGSLVSPPQVNSPFNLEQVLYRAISPHIAVEFEWDRSKVVKMGTLEQIPEGAANSYLRTSGVPSTDDRYRIPEGYLWRREGQPDCEFITRATLVEPVVVPLLNIQLPSAVTLVTATANAVYLDCVLRLHGLSVKLPTRN
jgi:hypothetical protein